MRTAAAKQERPISWDGLVRNAGERQVNTGWSAVTSLGGTKVTRITFPVQQYYRCRHGAATKTNGERAMNDEHSLAWPEITLGTALVPGAHLVTLRCGYCHHGIYVGDRKVVHYAGYCHA